MEKIKKGVPGACLVAVWPGMGQVALTAGYYLMSRLEMHEIDPIPGRDLFDVEFVEIKDGLIQKTTVPQGRLFLWKNPKAGPDVVVYLGESQPASGKNAFCDRLLDAAGKLGVRRVFTFAAMATDMRPEAPSRIFGIATDPKGLDALRKLDVEPMDSGRITGLNGVFLAAAAARGLSGIGLLGEIPSFASQVPFPKGSRRVLETFSSLTGVPIDLQELKQYEQATERHLVEIMENIEKTLQSRAAPETEKEDKEEAEEYPSAREPKVSEPDRARVEKLFREAQADRSKSFELKRELDRLDVFREYEDRFLDLFRKTG